MAKNCEVGDHVRVVSGNYEGRTGIVTYVRTPEDILFGQAPKSLSGSLIQEPYALVKTRLTNEIDGEQRDDEIGVPVRRLKPMYGG